jgi:hypothetical protein
VSGHDGGVIQEAVEDLGHVGQHPGTGPGHVAPLRFLLFFSEQLDRQGERVQHIPQFVRDGAGEAVPGLAALLQRQILLLDRPLLFLDELSVGVAGEAVEEIVDERAGRGAFGRGVFRVDSREVGEHGLRQDLPHDVDLPDHFGNLRILPHQLRPFSTDDLHLIVNVIGERGKKGGAGSGHWCAFRSRL